MTQRGRIALKILWVLLFGLVFRVGSVLAQETKPPVFWTHGGNWGNWLKITAHPGLAIRTACGDDTTLNNYPASSTDWQLRNNYTEPMAVVWRVQFFNDTSGKNEMSGWMLVHLKAGEVEDGWNVEGGHCQARNVISVQVKCAVPEADEAKCYNSNGNPYPPRPDGAYSGDHNPGGSQSGSISEPQATGNAQSKSQSKPHSTQSNTYWACFATDIFSAKTYYINAVFQHPAVQGENMNFNFYTWLHERHPEVSEGVGGTCESGDKAAMEARRQQLLGMAQHVNFAVVSLDWVASSK